ncbi:MAG: glycosyltransferase [Proteobacteria bacterium]|nr:glycosyltransferase [Pseudomonadota bacterium]
MAIDLSIVIPFYNDTHKVRLCLDSIERAMSKLPDTMPAPEIIVVDDHSPVPFDPGDFSLKVFCRRMEQNRGVGAARNLGARLSRGSHILFIDSDVVLGDDHLLRLYGHLMEKKGPIIQGPTSRIPANDPGSLFHHYLAVSWNFYQHENWQISVFTQCFAIEKVFFNNLGGFSEHFARSGGEEFELGLRLAKKKADSIFFDPDLIHFHHSEDLFKRLKKVYFRSRHIRKIALDMPNLPFRFTAQALMRSSFAFALDASVLLCLSSPLAGAGSYGLCAVLFYFADDALSKQMRKHHSLHLAMLSVVFRQLEYTFINLGMLKALCTGKSHDR